MTVLVGTSGWQYRDWRGVFYPPGLAQRRWLEHYTTAFDTVENNASFYRLPARETFAGWRERTPPGFVMAVKASRYLTHVRRLRDPAEPVTRMLSAATALGARLGPVLLQLPPTMRADPPLLAACLDQIAAFRGGGAAGGAEAAGSAGNGAGNGQAGPVRVAVEPRHESWWTDQARAVLAERNAALCWADRRGEPVTPLWRTADWGYLRFHEGTAWPWPRYPDKPLRAWAERLAAAWPGGDAYVYFNNDPGGAAIADAATFAAAAQAHGLPVSRVPAGVTPVPGVPGWEPWERPTRSPGSRG